MSPIQRQQLRALIDEWYRIILKGGPDAAEAAKKLAALAGTPPNDYEEAARRAFKDAGLATAEGVKPKQ